jgi:precorrin-6Y C5,15-methyltransferase (decarboxylating)
VASDQLEPAFERIALARTAGQSVVVLASGDPLWFGIGRLLLQRFGSGALRFHPAPASMQLAFARIGRPWQDARWISLHGREGEPLAAALQQRPAALAVLTDPHQGGAAAVRTILRASGLEAAYAFWLCERLGHPAERVQRLGPATPLPADLAPLNLVVLVAAAPPFQPIQPSCPLRPGGRPVPATGGQAWSDDQTGGAHPAAGRPGLTGPGRALGCGRRGGLDRPGGPAGCGRAWRSGPWSNGAARRP